MVGPKIKVPRLALRPGRAAGILAAAPALATALALSIAAPARADVGERIILRCTHNQSLAGFSPSAYDKALKELEADTEEYSDCSSLIRRAQELAAGGSSGGGGGGSPAGATGAAGAAAGAAIPATAAETQAIAHAAHANPGTVNLGGTPVRPGVIRASSAFGTLPTPLLATLAFLLAAALTFGAGAVRNRVRDRRSD